MSPDSKMTTTQQELALILTINPKVVLQEINNLKTLESKDYEGV